jgi:hypothetical protein
VPFRNSPGVKILRRETPGGERISEFARSPEEDLRVRGRGIRKISCTVVLMRMIDTFRSATEAVPEIAEKARKSLDNLDGGVRRANLTMLILAGVAVVALGVAVVALVVARNSTGGPR